MKIIISRESILKMRVDAIVNPANSKLREGGALCGAIFDKVRDIGGHQAHDDLTKACEALNGCPTGEAVMTPSFGLWAPNIIHAVGPIWTGRKPLPAGGKLTAAEAAELKALESVYCSILHLCEDNGLKSVAIPGISTGVYNFPKELAAAVALSVCRSHDIDLEVHLVAVSDDYYDFLTAAPSVTAVQWVASTGE
jgi:O-acetyl-ADP-ribose deacetylase (regulator of RNase III)